MRRSRSSPGGLLSLPSRLLSLPSRLLALPSVLVAFLGGCGGPDEPFTVAVASNFAATQEALAEAFQAWTGVPVRTVVGSTGQLYAQIRSGAPVDVYMAADAERPRRLEEEGLAVPGSRVTYAVGRLALYGAERSRPLPSLEEIGAVRDGAPEDERSPSTGGRLALADARVAPYGRAAEEVLRRLDLVELLEGRLVRGESIGQVHRFVESGAAEWGLVALTQVVDEPRGAWRLVPDSLHAPIRQEAVLLSRAAEDPTALAWMDFLHSAEARRLIREHGYEIPGGGG